MSDAIHPGGRYASHNCSSIPRAFGRGLSTAIFDWFRVTPEEFPTIFAEGWALSKPAPFLDYFLPLIHTQARYSQPAFPVAVGHTEIEHMFRRLFTLLPDMIAVPRHSAAHGNVVFVESDCTATLGGEMVAFAACDRFLIEDGFILERRSYSDPTPLLLAALRRPSKWGYLLRSREPYSR